MGLTPAQTHWRRFCDSIIANQKRREFTEQEQRVIAIGEQIRREREVAPQERTAEPRLHPVEVIDHDTGKARCCFRWERSDE